jgi:nucleotide-binding universal stress UspA family protein
MNTILVALDLEAGSDAVLSRAVQLATAHAARLVVLHAVATDMLPDAAHVSGHTEIDLRDFIRQQAHTTVDTLLIESGRPRRSDIRIDFGSPHEVITRVANEFSADLIVIAPHGRESLRAKILGSTADRVLRTSPMPILVVKGRSAEPYRNVAVAVDFSPQSEGAAKAAHKLAPEAAIELVHVIDIPFTFEQALRRTGTSSASIERYRRARAARARHDLSAFATNVIGLRGATARELQGAPGAVLVRLSRSKNIDLLAMGSHGRGVVLQTLLGSVAQRVLREAACDVLVATAWP